MLYESFECMRELTPTSDNNCKYLMTCFQLLNNNWFLESRIYSNAHLLILPNLNHATIETKIDWQKSHYIIIITDVNNHHDHQVTI